MSGWHGRRVTDPQPLFRGLRGEQTKNTNHGMSQIETAWDNLGRAKTTLHRAEHRVAQAEHPSATLVSDSLLRTSEPQRSVMIDRIPSYRLPEQTDSLKSSGYVDNHGRSQYLKAQSTRKISRLEDKYHEGVPDAALSHRQRSPLREPNFDFKHPREDKRDSRITGLSSTTANDIFHSSSAYRPFHTDPFGLRSIDSSSNTQDFSSFNQTDPRAIRETEIKFLNDDSYGRYRPLDTDYLSRGSKLTHVGVTVPGRKLDDRLGPSVTFADPLGTHRAHVVQAGIANGDTADLVAVLDLSSEAGSGNNSTFTVNTNNARTRKLRKGLKHLDPSSDVLSKLKEKIRIQRLHSPHAEGKGASSSPLQSEEGASGPVGNSISSQRVYHLDDEPIQPKTYQEYEPETTAPRVRKIAAGPAIPSYRGFAQVETKIRTQDGQIFKLSDANKARKVKERKFARMDVPKGEQKEQPVSAEQKTPQKVARVVAHAKPSKPIHTDLITTRSWRVGQQAILRELGPSKLPRTSNSPPTRDKVQSEAPSDTENEEEDKRAKERKRESKLDEDAVSAKSKALSEEAKAVLDDMQSDESDGEEYRENEEDNQPMRKKTVKRKRPKLTAEEEQQEKASKVRHYDSDEVRRYIARQRAERKKRQQEEQDRQRLEKQKKQQQLDELRKKQKETAKVPPQVAMQQGRPKDSTSLKKIGTVTLDYLPKKLPPQPSAESDKENHMSGASTPRSMSSTDSGSTSLPTSVSAMRQPPDGLIEESEKPPNGGPENVDKIIDKYSLPVPPGPGTKDSGIGTDENILNKYLSQSGISVEDVVNRYAGQAQDISSAFIGQSGRAGVMDSHEEYPGFSSLPAHVSVDSRSRGFRPLSATSGAAASGPRSRVDRIQAIRDTAMSLQNRLHQESQRIAHIGASGPDRWAQPRTRENELDVDYVSRYDKMAGKQDDYTVFSRDLPGSGNLSEQARHVVELSSQNEAATKIQAVYRGHTVRQGMGWTLPSGSTLGASIGIGKAARKAGTAKMDDSEESLLSDSTITEDSFDQHFPSSKKMGRSLKTADYHVDRKTDFGLKPLYQWDQPKGDPYSVMNIMARKYKGSVTFRKPLEHESGRPASQENMIGASVLGKDEDSLSFSSEGSSFKDRSSGENVDLIQSHHSVSHKSRTSGSTGNDDKSSITSVSRASQRSHTSHRGSAPRTIDSVGENESHKLSHRTQSRSQKELRSRKNDRLKANGSNRPGMGSDDDTLDGTLTPSGMSDIEVDKSDNKSATSASKERSVVLSSRHKSRSVELESLDSDLSSLDHGESREDPLKEYARNTARYTGRISPGGLERRMTAELNLLEGVDESIRQLTDVERSRAVSMAQQETVSLAQILKARQQSHQQDMVSLQVRAQQEAHDASRQLEDSRRRAAEAAQNAAQVIAQVRTESTSVQESTQKLLATQAEAARATAEAARQLAEAKHVAASQNSFPPHDPHKVAMETASAAAAAAVSAALQHRPWQPLPYQVREDRGTQFSRSSDSRSPTASRTDPSRTDVSQSYASESYDSSYTRSPVPSSKVVSKRTSAIGSGSISTESSIPTASDLSRGRPGSAASIPTASIATDSNLGPRHSPPSRRTVSSIRTESGAASPGSRTQSVVEELPSMSERGEDYTVDFDTSVAEDLEQSIRDVLPAASQRKKMKKEGSQSDLTSSEDLSLSGHPDFTTSSSRRLSFDEESFTRFNVDMVKQYMREEEIRSQHKASLLKLREKALKEKMQAELAWLEQQKKRLRDKGADDVYPQIKKKQRGILIKLKQEQAEIKRLQEAHKAASRERQYILEQSKELVRIKQSTRQMKERLKHKGASNEKPAVDLATEDELSLHLDDNSETITETPRRDKSDSEYSAEEGKEKRPPSPSDAKAMQKLKKMKLDENRYLTVREQKLRKRRLAAEELLAWSRKLDEEEEDVARMEQEVLAKYNRVRGRDHQGHAEDKKAKKAETQEPKTPRTPRTARTEASITSLATESIPTSVSPSSHQNRDTSKSSIPEEVTSVQQSAITESSIPEDVSDGKSSPSQATSVPEDVPSQSTSIAEEVPSSDKKTPDSSDDNTVVNSSVNESYTNETFESPTAENSAATVTRTQTQTATQTATSRHAGGPGSPRQGRLSKLGLHGAPMSPKSPFASPGRRGSESESEDSFSVSHSAETASDVSDVEGRIRALSDELKRRKLEAERLKREQKRKNKDRLRAQEASLKKQIEAYDSYINQVKTELQEAESEHGKPAVPPKIKQPAESKRLKKTPEPVSPASPPETKLESESSKSNSSFEESKDVTVDTSYTPFSASAQASPIAPSADETPRHQETPSPHRSQAYTESQRSSLEGDSETRESVASHSSKKTSTPEQDSGRRVQSPDQSLSKQDSDILEDIPEEENSLESKTVTSEHSELKLNLEYLNDTKVPEREDVKATPHEVDTCRTESAIPEESLATGRSETSQHYTEDFVSKKESVAEPTPRTKSPEPKAPVSARSESADSVASEYSIGTGADDNSEQSTVSQQDDKSDSSGKVKSEVSWHEDKSEHSDISHRSQASEQNAVVSQQSDKSEKSYSYSTSSVSSKSERTYSEDSSRTSRSYTSSRSKSVATSSVSHKSQEPEVKVMGASQDAVESTHTDEDISEQVLVESDDEDQLPELTFDLKTSNKSELPEKSEVEATEKVPSADIVEDPIPEINIGDSVVVDGTQTGILRFKGICKFASGFWCGVELHKPEGSSDGSRDGVQYFICKAQHGVFAPADKLKLYSEADNIIDEELPSDISEHTITEDKSYKSDSLSAKSKDLSSPRKDRSHDTSSAKEKKGDEDDESITEDISTSSELERVISSAAEAVEGFDQELADSLTVGKGPMSFSQPEENEVKKEEVVDKITDGLTSLIVKDTVKIIGDIKSEREDRFVENEDSLQKLEELDGNVTFLGLDENKENKTEIIVEPKKKETKHEGKQDKAADVAVQNLLNEAISQMLTIRKRQRDKTQNVETDSSESSPTHTPDHSPVSAQVDTPRTPDEEIELEKIKAVEDKDSDLLSDDMFRTRVQLETHGDLPPLNRPVSPVGLEEKSRPAQDDLDQLYKELGGLSGLGDEDEWFDDDFGLSTTQKAPPPYPETDQLGANSRSELKLNLQKLAETPFYAVPHKPDEIKTLVGDVIDVFWERRRYGESWDEVEPPSSLFMVEDKGSDMESNSRRVYKTHIFHLTGEILRDMYQEEDDEVEQPSWSKPKRLRSKYHQCRQPPTTSDALKPIVEEQVLNLLSSTGRKQSNRLANRWAGRKKKDHVDMILVQELREEEPSWVNYDDDELTVKMQLADAIFDSLVTETAKVMQDALAKKQ